MLESAPTLQSWMNHSFLFGFTIIQQANPGNAGM